MTTSKKTTDILIVAGNARSLIANRGDLIKSLQARGLNVCAAIPNADYLPEAESLGIEVVRFDMARATVSPLKDIRTLFSLWKTMRRFRPTVVFSYTVKPVVYGSLAARLAGVPRVYSMITGLGYVFGEEEGQRRRWLRRVVSKLYAVALARNDHVFFQNPDDLNEFRAQGVIREVEKAVRINGSGVNLERFREFPVPQGAPVFLYVGRLLREKGVGVFAEAAQQIKARHPNARFVVVGPHDPSLPGACSEEELARWKALGGVEFVGGVKDVRPYLNECSVFVFPSCYREGTPRCVLEAMSVGRAVITSDAPGCRETVMEGVNGFLVPPRSVETLVEIMQRFIDHPELAVTQGRASRALVEEKYDVVKVNRVLLDSMELS